MTFEEAKALLLKAQLRQPLTNEEKSNLRYAYQIVSMHVFILPE